MAPKRIAVFDIDGTVFRSAVSMEIIDRLVERGTLSAENYAGIKAKRDAWKNRRGSFEEYVKEFDGFITSKGLAGTSVTEVERESKAIIESIKDHQYLYTRRLMENLRKDGVVLIAISGMLINLMRIYNEHLKFDHIFGSSLVERDGLFTDKAEDNQAYTDKAGVLRRLLADHSHYTLQGSVGIGDTQGDVGFLELVDRPIAFNPNRNLYDIAIRNDWEIVVERKDMIYLMRENSYSVDK